MKYLQQEIGIRMIARTYTDCYVQCCHKERGERKNVIGGDVIQNGFRPKSLILRTFKPLFWNN